MVVEVYICLFPIGFGSVLCYAPHLCLEEAMLAGKVGEIADTFGWKKIWDKSRPGKGRKNCGCTFL